MSDVTKNISFLRLLYFKYCAAVKSGKVIRLLNRIGACIQTNCKLLFKNQSSWKETFITMFETIQFQIMIDMISEAI